MEPAVCFFVLLGVFFHRLHSVSSIIVYLQTLCIRLRISLARYYPLLVGRMVVCASVAPFGWHACTFLVPHSFI